MEKRQVIIRDETPRDIDALHNLTYRAFLPMNFSDNSEADAIRIMRQSGNLTLSLVGELTGHVVGHVAFSPVKIDGAFHNWYALGPISVDPDHQRQGIGRALIATGLGRLHKLHAEGCVLTGNPDIYAGSGFLTDGRFIYGDLDQRYIQHIQFHGTPRKGTLQFVPGLD